MKKNNRTEIIKLRVTKEEKFELMKLADKRHEGNVSAFIRYILLNKI